MSAKGFDLSLFKSSLQTRWAGQTVILLDECDSTNDRARALKNTQRPVGTLILAESQSAGRGRWGRRWESVKEKSLLMTLVLPEAVAEMTAPRMGVAIGVALSRACESYGVTAKIKWPNDLMMDGKKMAGMLMETLEGGLAVGIGINVNQCAQEFPVELQGQVTSMAMVTGKVCSREKILAILMLEIEKSLKSLQQEGFESLKRAWHTRAMYLGDPVRVQVAGESGESLEGTLMGLDFDGALLVRQDQGLILPVVAGDILNLRPALT